MKVRVFLIYYKKTLDLTRNSLKMKILDCTLRDGGYYTNWDFNWDDVKVYLDSLNQLPIDYIEFGYRSVKLKGYLGEYFYCPQYLLEKIRTVSNKKLVIILNEKDIKDTDVYELLTPCVGLIDMVRIAIDPKSFSRALKLAAAVKNMGFEVGFNVMYMSKWKENKEFLELIKEVNGVCDYFYMVDSYGGVFPEDVRNIYQLVKSQTDVPIGFHGHNNLELALINTLTAIEQGVDIVDCTITGMGRGAGNLKTELLLTVLSSQGKLNFPFNDLSKTVDTFTKIQNMYEWGTNLPYMVSGANSLPQKEVMDWVGKRYYSFNSIIRALNNQSKGVQDNQKLSTFSTNERGKYPKAVIVGGGSTAIEHSTAIKKYLESNPALLVIHASSKNAMAYKSIPNKQIFCLVGNEGHRMEDVFCGEIPDNTICVLPPFPRKMGTYIPSTLKENAYELKEVSFSDKYCDSHTAIALQTIVELDIKSVELVGYDGYSNTLVGKKEQELLAENEYLFTKLVNKGVKCSSLTPTAYKMIEQQSIYSIT